MSATAAYRPDIDGLRSVAVVSVVLFHLRFGFARGGFVGVDVFFVLTGFLITSIIYREILANTFSFKRFYLRRIRRIVPAMLFVLVVTTVAAFLLLLPDDLLAYLSSVRAALLSVSNVFFLDKTHGYFHGNADAMPLLHTWSLGVEEQFYLFWPAVLIVGLRVLPRRTWKLAFCAILVLSVALSELAAWKYPSVAYYVLPTRAYEIMLGAVPVVFAEHLPVFSRRINDALSIVGIAMIFASLGLLTGADRFPGLNALWPCLGALFLILSGRTSGAANATGIANRALSFRPFVSVGLISYSVYLWHWPLIAFLNYRGVEVQGVVRGLALVVPFVLAWISYVVVETPFRTGLHIDFRKAVGLLVVVPIVCGFAVHAYAGAHDGFPARFAAVDELRADAGKRYGRCELGPEVGDAGRCSIGVKKDRVDGLLIGDSYGDMYVNFMDVLAKDAGMSFHYSNSSHTPPIRNVSCASRPDARSLEYNRRRVEMAAKYPFVVLISSWSGYGEKNKENRLWDEDGRDVSADADRLQLETIDWLVSQGVTPIFVDRPSSPPLRVTMAKARAAKQTGKLVEEYRQPFTPRAADYAFNQLKARYPSAVFIHPSDVLCDQAGCDVSIKGTLLYKEDGSHLNPRGSELLGQTYVARQSNPLKRTIGFMRKAEPE